MNVDKIARLFQAQTGPAQVKNNTNTSASSEVPTGTGDAVSIAPQLQSAAAQNDDSGRAEKVARIAAAVKDGTYRKSSNEIAAAVYKELFI